MRIIVNNQEEKDLLQDLLNTLETNHLPERFNTLLQTIQRAEVQNLSQEERTVALGQNFSSEAEPSSQTSGADIKGCGERAWENSDCWVEDVPE